MASRILAAFAGGYGLVTLLSIALPLLLAQAGYNQAQALLATTIGSFLVYAAIIMAVFHARSAVCAWVWLAGLAIPPAFMIILFLPRMDG